MLAAAVVAKTAQVAGLQAPTASPADIITAIAALVGAVAWPALAAVLLVLMLRGGAQSRLIELTSALLARLPTGSKLALGPFQLEGPPAAIASNTIRATTEEGPLGASLEDAPTDIVERLRTGSFNGAVGTYPYLLHAATEQRAPTTPRTGRYSVRIWIEFDPKEAFAGNSVKRVLYRLHETWAPDRRVIATASLANGFELWLSTYGEFTLVAVVEKTNGDLIWLTRYLDLPGRPSD